VKGSFSDERTTPFRLMILIQWRRKTWRYRRQSRNSETMFTKVQGGDVKCTKYFRYKYKWTPEWEAKCTDPAAGMWINVLDGIGRNSLFSVKWEASQLALH
jgi:hypothetical protein